MRTEREKRMAPKENEWKTFELFLREGNERERERKKTAMFVSKYRQIIQNKDERQNGINKKEKEEERKKKKNREKTKTKFATLKIRRKP